MDREVKYKIIMCNLSATGYGEGLITGENHYLVILYKDNNKARYEKIDLEVDIDLIEITNEKEGYIYINENTTKSVFGEKTNAKVTKVVIPEDIMFKSNNS